jgi:hypothetical protein
VQTDGTCGDLALVSAEAAHIGLVDAAAQVPQILDDLRAAQAGIEGELAGQVADQLFDLRGLC